MPRPFRPAPFLPVLCRRLHGWIAGAAVLGWTLLSTATLARAEEKAATGLPQLDTSTFASQIFWLLVFFGILYLVMARLALPKVARVIDTRERRINSDFERAILLKSDAQVIERAYENALAEARTTARTLRREAEAEIAARSEAGTRTAVEANAKRAIDAERAIEAARSAAMGNIRSVSMDVVQAASLRVAGVEVTDTLAGEVVDMVLQERR